MVGNEAGEVARGLDARPGSLCFILSDELMGLLAEE